MKSPQERRRIGVVLALPNTAIVVHAVGQELVQHGKLAPALAHYREAIAGLPSSHPHIPSVMTAMGQILLAQGVAAEAIQHLRAGLRGKRDAISQSHPFTAFSLMDLGAAYVANNQPAEALESYRKAIPILDRRLGALNPKTISCHLAIGRLLAPTGQLDAAKEHIDKVLASEMYGLGNASEIGVAYATLGQIVYHQGDLDVAIGHFQQALSELADLPDTHPDVLSVLHDLGRAYHRQGESERALQTFERALIGYQASVGSEHTGTATALNAMGQVLYAQGKYDAALDRYHQALEIRQRVLGAMHPQTITSRFNCGTAMRELGDPFGTEEMESAAEALEELLGRDHPHVKATRSWLR